MLAEEASNSTTDPPSEGTLVTTGAVAEGDKTAADGSSGEKGEAGGEREGEAKKTAEEEEEAAAMKGLRKSEEELAKLKEEQEERCKELAMNVNVFMPYKVCPLSCVCLCGAYAYVKAKCIRRCPAAVVVGCRVCRASLLLFCTLYVAVSHVVSGAHRVASSNLVKTSNAQLDDG